MAKFLRGIKSDKIKINWNTKPIEMEKFLSFLTIETKVPEDGWLGKWNGWTKKVGKNDLIITGGIVNRVEYIDSIQYGKRLENPYNNYVTPFSLWDIMTEEGREFFLDYYNDDIKSILNKKQQAASSATIDYNETDEYWRNMGFEMQSDISANTLAMIDKSAQNFREGNVSEPVEVKEQGGEA